MKCHMPRICADEDEEIQLHKIAVGCISCGHRGDPIAYFFISAVDSLAIYWPPTAFGRKAVSPV